MGLLKVKHMGIKKVEGFRDMRRQALSLLVENNPGVTSRISGLFSRRGYNIDSFSSGVTADPKYTRITIVASGEKNKLTVLDLYSYSQKHPEWYQEDGVRLNKDGALAVADMVGDCIINKTK